MNIANLLVSDWISYARPLLTWVNSSFVVGTSGADTIARAADGLTLSGLGGNDQLTAQGGRNTLLGGSGDDTLSATGNGNILFGETGKDTLTATGNGNIAWGGTGNDVITLTGQNASGNTGWGGTGNDTLSAFGHDNRLYGGTGDDVLISRSFSVGQGIQIGNGTVMSGGSGQDRFELNNTSALAVRGDGNGVVSAGDSFVGVIDVISDYRAGEVIETGATTRVTAPVAVGALNTIPPGEQGALLGVGEYALFRGALDGPGRFTLADAGPDVLMIYETAQGSYDPTASGAVVLRGFGGGDVLVA